MDDKRNGGGRFYRRATFLSLAAIAIFAVFYSVDFIMEGWAEKVWIVLAGCAASCGVILLFRRARGFFNPAFSVPFLVYLLYLTGSMLSGRFTGYFTVFFCVCGLAAMYLNRWKFLHFILLSNAISLVLILAGVPMIRSMGLTFSELLVNWIFTVFGSLFMYLVIQFVSEKIVKSARAEDSFETMLSSTPDYIVLVDDLNCVTYISKALAEFAHIEDPKMALGRPLLDLFRDMDVKLKAAEIVDSHDFYEGTWELRLNGEARYFRIISNRLLGETKGLFVNLSDISPVMKARFEAEAAARAKSAFLANTSHEIRTPMNAILGMAELILRKDVSPGVYEDAQNIKQAGTNLLALINDILDFSKIESGKLDIIPQGYRFDSLLNDVLSIIKMRLTEKPVQFITRIDGSLPLVLIGDEVRVRQVLLNLLSNAVKYTVEGDICFSVSALTREAERITLVFEVADTGVGIKPEDMNRLFGEFVQFDSRANRGVEGTGLGLAISRNLCRLMGGDAGAESVYGEGSVFRAIIPQGVQDPAPFAGVADPGGKRVLICEGRRKQGEALAYTAERLGAPYALAAGVEELRERLREGAWDYALIAAPLFGEALPVLRAGAPGTAPVFLPDFGEGPPVPGLRSLPLPVQPLTLARLLNGEAEFSAAVKDGVFSARFTAPRARILVVDDIGTNLKVAGGLLAPYKAGVDTCLSGAEALEMVKDCSYDIIFMDHMMPGMDGIETAAAIRAWEERQGGSSPDSGPGAALPRQTPIIALTANAISGMREMFLERGFNDYLSKPIEIAKLNEIMERWIPREKRERAAGNGGNRGTVPGPEEWGALREIPGLDLNRGIAGTGGTLGGYKQVLALFRRDAEDRLGFLRGFPGETAPGDLAAFTTQVHALKSAAASLGAGAVSAEAARLEAAGKAGDLALIREALPGFVAALGELAEGIRAALEEGGGDSPEAAGAGIGGEAGAGPLLRELAEALGLQKAEAIERLLGELDKKDWPPAFRAKLDHLSDQVLTAEFGEAAGTVENLLEEISGAGNGT
jgi:signal transduction histidine kinase/FixJ family two-component response regulator/HPt (histidine-containing phosphotransfer) domain-containing protein